VEQSTLGRALSLATLARSRALLRESHGFLLIGTIGALYALIAMYVGQMLTFGHTPLPNSATIVTQGAPFWDFPALIVIAPNAVLVLPFFGTLTMAIAAGGVGIGMGVAVVLTARLLRQRRAGSARPTAIGTAAGLTPVMLTLVTLGACCSTTAAATAGISLAAQSSGTSLFAVLANNWYLGVFQLAILWVALLAQEQIVAVYGILFGVTNGEGSATALAPPPVSVRSGLGAALRVTLVASGLTWALAAVADWTTVSPFNAPAAAWADWIGPHFLLGGLAVIAGLAPEGIDRALRTGPRAVVRSVRAVVGVTAVTLLLWMPPTLAAAGWDGLGNEVLGALGVSPALGAAAPPVGGLALALEWLFQYLLIGAFALGIAIAPRTVVRPMLPSTSASGGPSAVDLGTAASSAARKITATPWGDEP
jgi:hypothetical protein